MSRKTGFLALCLAAPLLFGCGKGNRTGSVKNRSSSKSRAAQKIAEKFVIKANGRECLNLVAIKKAMADKRLVVNTNDVDIGSGIGTLFSGHGNEQMKVVHFFADKGPRPTYELMASDSKDFLSLGDIEEQKGCSEIVLSGSEEAIKIDMPELVKVENGDKRTNTTRVARVAPVRSRNERLAKNGDRVDLLRFTDRSGFYRSYHLVKENVLVITLYAEATGISCTSDKMVIKQAFTVQPEETADRVFISDHFAKMLSDNLNADYLKGSEFFKSSSRTKGIPSITFSHALQAIQKGDIKSKTCN